MDFKALQKLFIYLCCCTNALANYLPFPIATEGSAQVCFTIDLEFLPQYARKICRKTIHSLFMHRLRYFVVCLRLIRSVKFIAVVSGKRAIPEADFCS